MSTPLPRAAGLAAVLVSLAAAVLPLPAGAQTPAALAHFGTYLGGNQVDRIVGVSQFESDVIVVGTTRSNSIAAGAGGTARANADIFVAHFNSDGALNSQDFANPILIFGGDGDDEPTAMFLGPGREVYVVGKTTSVDGFAAGKKYGTATAGPNAFVARVAATNTDYDWFMFLSGNLEDVATGVTFVAPNVYVSGWTRSTNFLGTTNPPGGMNGFVTEILMTPSGATTVPSIGWNLKPAILGGSQDDSFNGITVGPGGKLYVTGTTSSTGFAYGGKVLNTYKGGFSDAWVVQLPVSTGLLDWVSYVGGSGADQGNAVAVPSGQQAFVVAGTTSSPGNLGSGNALSETNAFVAWMSFTGQQKSSEVRLGSHNDVVQAVTTDSAGNAYVGGNTGSTTFARVPETGFDTAIEATAGTELREGFVWMAPPEGGDGWSSYVGGGGVDELTSLNMASSGSDKLLIGLQTTSSSGMPGLASPGSYDTTLDGTDGYLLSVAVRDITPPGQGTVFDRPQLDISNVDIDSTASTNALYANWTGFVEDTGIVKYEWALGTRANPFLLQQYTSVGGQRSGAAPGLPLVRGQEYIVTVRATSTYGLTRVDTSDGVTVEEPDAGVPGGTDAGTGGTDAGTEVPDAGTGGADGGTGGADAGTDGGTTNPPDGGGGGGGGDDEDPESPVGWGCATGGGAAPLLLLGLFALVLAGRRLRVR